MKSTLVCSILLAISSSAWSATTTPPASLPTADDISEAVATVSAIQGSISELVAQAEGDGGNLENDRLARDILLRMSQNAEGIVDDLDTLDQLIAAKKYTEASAQQKQICTDLNKLKSDNSNAKIGADLPDPGNLSSSDPLFGDIDSDVKDTRKVLKCK